MSKLITDPEQIRLQEESEVQALLGHPPAWMTRWGISLVAITVLGLLVMGFLIRYPDIVEAPAVIQTEYPPIRLEAKADGRISQFLAKDGQQVVPGDLLLVLQNPTSFTDVRLLEDALKQLIPAIRDKNILAISLPQDLQLASLQQFYSQVNSELESHQFRLKQDDVAQRIVNYRQQIKQNQALNEANDQEIITLTEEVEIARENKEKYKILEQKGAASALEAEEAQTSFLRYRRELEAKKRDFIKNDLEIQNLQNQIIALAQEESTEIKQGWIQLAEAVNQMQGVLEEWKDKYLIQAPLAGQVILSRVWSKNQSINAGEAVLTIDPGNQENEITVRAKLPVARSGKVEEGQKVLLRLASYPYKEFGALAGKIQSIAPLPEPDEDQQLIYHLIINLNTDSLITTSGSPIPFTQEMQSTARIITEDRSFLERVMDELFNLFRDS